MGLGWIGIELGLYFDLNLIWFELGLAWIRFGSDWTGIGFGFGFGDGGFGLGFVWELSDSDLDSISDSELCRRGRVFVGDTPSGFYTLLPTCTCG